MGTPERFKSGRALPSFEGEAQAFADRERSGEDVALSIAIAEASTAAAAYMDENGITNPLTFQVSRILVVVSPNPGPTTYRALLTPGG
jgi:hypothetical protein